MATDLIRYDLLVQEALRSVVRKVLTDAARDGLQGEHHFYITFKTHAPGVRLSARMRNQYPTEMTIILQHQFWGLNVLEQGFEVGLSFQKIPETLFIPFEALTGFFDPSVQFGLKFESEIGANDVEGPIGLEARAAEPQDLTAVSSDAGHLGARPAAALLPGEHADEGAGDAPQSEEAKVISIDAFRKKP
jgi:uncharacterized protein